MPSIIRKIKEKHILERRGAYVTKRPDAATRTTALPPPKKKSKVVDKKAVVIERKEVETKYESDDETLLDEKALEAGSLKKDGKIARRGVGDWNEKEGAVENRYRARRRVVRSETYTEEENVEVRGTRTKSWWTRMMTVCMPSEG